jgi:hypothetical protein
MENLLNFDPSSSTAMLVAGLICGFIISVAAILLMLVRRRAAAKTSGEPAGEKRQKPEKVKKEKPPKPEKKNKKEKNRPEPETVAAPPVNNNDFGQSVSSGPNILPPVSNKPAPGAVGDGPPPAIDLRQKLANAAKPEAPGEAPQVQPVEITLAPSGGTAGGNEPLSLEPAPTAESAQPAELDRSTFLEAEEEAEKPAVNDAFSIFTDMEAEETETSKFAKTLNNVNINDLHQEIQDVAEQLKGWR